MSRLACRKVIDQYVFQTDVCHYVVTRESHDKVSVISVIHVSQWPAIESYRN